MSQRKVTSDLVTSNSPLDGLWEQNPALVQMLGLCPLMAVTTTTVNGFALGLGTMAVLVCSNLLISALRHWLRGSSTIYRPVYC